MKYILIFLFSFLPAYDVTAQEFCDFDDDAVIFWDGCINSYYNGGLLSWDDEISASHNFGDGRYHVGWNVLYDPMSNRNVLEVNHSQKNVWGSLGFFSNIRDLSEYTQGELQFDIKVLERGVENVDLFVALNCHPQGCTSADFEVPNEHDGQWQTIRIPFQNLIESGLDVAKVSAPFAIYANWGVNQQNLSYQIADIRLNKSPSGSDVGSNSPFSGAIFTNGVAAPWSGFGSWDNLIYTNQFSGSSSYHVQWQLSEAARSGNDVASVSFNQLNTWGSLYVYHPLTHSAGFDYSDYSGGTFSFDINVISHGEDDADLLFSIACIPRDCITEDFIIPRAPLGSWQTVEVPAEKLINSGLDITQVTVALSIYSSTQLSQAGIKFDLSNIRWNKQSLNPQPEQVSGSAVFYDGQLVRPWLWFASWDDKFNVTQRTGSELDHVRWRTVYDAATNQDVLDVTYSDEPFWGTLRIIGGSEQDYSAYSEGSLSFDIKVISRGESDSDLLASVACNPNGCISDDVVIPRAAQSTWQTVTISLSDLIEDGLDITRVVSPLNIYTPYGVNQQGVRYQLANIRWDSTPYAPMLAATENSKSIGFFSSFNGDDDVSVIRVVNSSNASGEVTVKAYDDMGNSGAVSFNLSAFEGKTFNSETIETGVGFGAESLLGTLGSGEGEWRFQISSSSIDIDNLKIVNLFRTAKGDLSNLSASLSPVNDNEYWLPYFSSLLDVGKESLLRLNNPSEQKVSLTVQGFSESGDNTRIVNITLGPFQSKTLSTSDLEYGNTEDGIPSLTELAMHSESYSLKVIAEQPINVSLLHKNQSSGSLSNISDEVVAGDGDSIRTVYFFNPASNNGQRSQLRLSNFTNFPQSVVISGVDDLGQSGVSNVSLELAPLASVSLSASDLEYGSTVKGLTGAFGDGEGKWRLVVDAHENVRVMSLVRNPTGLLSNMSRLLPANDNGDIEVVTFNPASNSNQISVLRLYNDSETNALVNLTGTDDAGNSRNLQVFMQANSAVTLTSSDLESGNPDKNVISSLGDGVGKWSLVISSEQDVKGFTFLRAPTTNIFNMSRTVD